MQKVNLKNIQEIAAKNIQDLALEYPEGGALRVWTGYEGTADNFAIPIAEFIPRGCQWDVDDSIDLPNPWAVHFLIYDQQVIAPPGVEHEIKLSGPPEDWVAAVQNHPW